MVSVLDVSAEFAYHGGMPFCTLQLIRCVLLFAILSCTKSVQPPKQQPPVFLKTSADKVSLTTQDTLKFTLELESDKTISVSIPEIGAQITGFRITDYGASEKEIAGRILRTKWYQLQADVTGSYILPSVQLEYELDQKKQTAKTSEIFIEVTDSGVTNVPTELKDIKGLYRKSIQYGYRVGLVLLVTVLAGLIYFWMKRRKEKPLQPLSAKDAALLDLEKIQLHDALSPEELKKSYFALSHILKKYVEEQFQFPATDRTLEELSVQVGEVLNESNKLPFLAMVREAEKVKFTDYRPTHIQWLKEQMVEFIIATGTTGVPAESEP